MSMKVKINRLPTGVPGLDEILGGGLPEFSFNIIAGAPGCGKTTLAHQIMFANATPERPALYFTVLGEPAIKMLRYQQQFDFFDSESINHSVRFINLSDDAMAGDLDQVLRRIVAEVEAHAPALVFVDSFRSVVIAGRASGREHNNLQQFVQQLGMLMTSWQATTFLIGEYFTETDANPVFTVADGLIWLRQSVQRNSDGPQDGDHEDARPGDAAGPAHLSHQPRRHRGVSPQRGLWAPLRGDALDCRPRGC